MFRLLWSTFFPETTEEFHPGVHGGGGRPPVEVFVDADESTRGEIRAILARSQWPWTFSVVDRMTPATRIHCRFAREDERRGEDRGGTFVYFSWTWTNLPVKLVVFDPENWQTGALSQMAIGDYREYLVNHEIGHALGFDHSTCTRETCGVMHQATAGYPAGIQRGSTQPTPLDTVRLPRGSYENPI